MSETNIYQQIWESDENQFSVSTRTSSGEWEDETADILLDEQVKASGQREIDLATRPLFYKVNEDKLFDETRTYSSFIKLLDNYAIRSLDPEFTPEEEEHEQLDFISLILSTKPIQLARNYINEELGENLSEQQFRIKLQRIWFEHYTNYYKGKSTHFASGFEHVFVGEGKYNIRSGDKRETLGTISGYHSWVKFYLDEKNQRVNFLGYKYDLRGNEGPNNPNVVTLQM
ncbi:MAG: endoribonuclease, partial [Moorea sp. SIO2C4]|nr:endoribonuclease [Moorena sp. SIO2C4]